MTITELRERVKSLPTAAHHFGQVDRLMAWIDWELRPDRGNGGLAPRAIWDDDGVLLLCEGDTVSLHFGCRRGGKWAAFSPPPTPPRNVPSARDAEAGDSSKGQSEVGAGDGIPLVV